jgi:hypothetical protein
MFPGFTLPDGAWLPPELLYLLPNISGAKLKVIIAILYHWMQVGGSEPLSLTDIERFTGLARNSVIAANRDLLRDCYIERHQVGDSYLYSPAVSVPPSAGASAKIALPGAIIEPASAKIALGNESERELIINDLKDSLTDSLKDSAAKIALLQSLRSCGVYLKTAQGLVDQYPERIEQKIRFYRHALAHNLAQSPGWLVQAIKEDWGEPLGWKPASSGNGAGFACACDHCAPLRQPVAYAEWESE